MSNDLVSIKLPTFDGKEGIFAMFWTRFKAYASMKGFLLAIQENAEADLPVDETTVLDPNDPVEAAQEKARKRNSLAVASFTMAFTTATLMMLVHWSCNADYPSGLGWQIVKGLFKRYRPSDNITHVELRMMLNCVTMRPNDDPLVLFEQLNKIQEAYASASLTCDENDLIAIVITAAPSKYQPVLAALQLEKGKKLKLTICNKQ